MMKKLILKLIMMIVLISILSINISFANEEFPVYLFDSGQLMYGEMASLMYEEGKPISPYSTFDDYVREKTGKTSRDELSDYNITLTYDGRSYSFRRSDHYTDLQSGMINLSAIINISEGSTMDTNATDFLRHYYEHCLETGNFDAPFSISVTYGNETFPLGEVLQPANDDTPMFESLVGMTAEQFGEYLKKLDQNTLEVPDPEDPTEPGTDPTEPGTQPTTPSEPTQPVNPPQTIPDGLYTYNSSDNGFTLSAGKAGTYQFKVKSDGYYYIDKPTQVGGSKEGFSNHITPLAKAGIKEGVETVGDNEKAYGSVLVYDRASNRFDRTDDYNTGNCYPLLGGKSYLINIKTNNDRVTFIRIGAAPSGGKLQEVLLGSSNEVAQSESNPDKVEAIYISKGSIFQQLSKLLSFVIRAMANGLNNIIQASLNATRRGSSSQIITIDDLIFNHYDQTTADFYDNNLSDTSVAAKMKGSINKWYNVFFNIASLGYIVALLYIAVRMLINVGGKEQSKNKELLLYWLKGLGLLFLFKYAIYAMMYVNNSMVVMIEESKVGALNISNEKVTAQIQLEYPSSVDEAKGVELGATLDTNIYDGLDNVNFMAEMANRAERSKRIADAVVYLIMVLQFITLVIFYYKRVFMIGFLIVIYPFVALSYVFDKIGDGKSQALDTWIKELSTNIFIQTIHAIAYVFVLGATYTAGSYNGDWLLSIVGITFLFKAESILRNMFDLGGSTARSLADTASRTVAAVAATKAVAKNVGDNFSHIGRTVRSYRNYRAENKIAQNDRLFAYDSTTPATESELASSLAHYSAGLPRARGTTSARGRAKASYNELARAIHTVNNSGANTDPKVLADALKVLQKNANSTDSNIRELMKDLKISPQQLNMLNNLQAGIKQTLLDGDLSTEESRKQIKTKVEQEIELHLEKIMPAATKKEKEVMKRALLHNIADPSLNVSLAGSRRKSKFDINAIADEYNDKKEQVDSFFNPYLSSSRRAVPTTSTGAFKIFDFSTRSPKFNAEAQARYERILTTKFSVTPDKATKDQRRLARGIVITQEFAAQGGNMPVSGAYSSTQRFSARQYLQAAKDCVELTQSDSTAKRVFAAEMTYMSGTKPVTLTAEDTLSVVSETIARNFTKVPAGASRDDFRSHIDEGFDTELIPTKRAITSIDTKEASFYDRTKRRGALVPFEINDTEVALSSDGTKVRDRLLLDKYGIDMSDPVIAGSSDAATRRKIEDMTALAMVKEYRSQTIADAEFTPGGRKKYDISQLVPAFESLSKHESESSDLASIISSEIPVSMQDAKTYLRNETRRQYDRMSTTDQQRLTAIVGESYLKPTASERVKDSLSQIERGKIIDENVEAWREALSLIGPARDIDESSLSQVSAKDILMMNREQPMADGRAYASALAPLRNSAVTGIATEMIKDLGDVPTFEGLTQEEHKVMAKSMKQKAREELVRSGLTSTGVVLGGLIGAPLAVGVGDDSSIVNEMLVGAAGGMLTGDKIAEEAVGGVSSKTVKVISPYTGKEVEVKITRRGVTKADAFGSIRENEVVHYDDPRFSETLMYDIDRQLLENKKKVEQERLNEKRNMFRDALGPKKPTRRL